MPFVHSPGVYPVCNPVDKSAAAMVSVEMKEVLIK